MNTNIINWYDDRGHAMPSFCVVPSYVAAFGDLRGAIDLQTTGVKATPSFHAGSRSWRPPIR